MKPTTISMPTKPLPWLILSLLCACQASVNTHTLRPMAIQDQTVQTARPTVRLLPKAAPYGKVEALPIHTTAAQRDLRVQIVYPQTPSGVADFQTQAFGCSEVAFARIWADGPGMGQAIYADGADPLSHLIATTGCGITANLSNVPFGTRLINVQLYDSQQQVLTGSLLKAPMRLNSGAQAIELSYRQLAAGQVLQSLIQHSLDSEFIAGQLDLAQLQSLIDSQTQTSGSFPNYTFVNPPALLNIQALRDAILGANGDLSALSAGPQFLQMSGSLSFDLAGYLINQAVDVSIDDALSPNAVATGNGQITLNHVPPGQWYLRLSGPGYLNRRIAVNVSANQQTAQGTVTIYPPQATLTGLTPGSGGRHLNISLSGTDFNPTLANNIVRFGGTLATVTAASTTSLSVNVPNNLNVGTYPISVTIGAANAATGHNYSVVAPVISAVSASSGSTNDTLTLTGTGFSDTDAENFVYFGSATGTLISATPTQIVAQVPEGQAGSAGIRVETQGLSSNSVSFTRLPRISALTTAETVSGKAVLIRSRTLTIAGTNFDPTPANNQVRFTLSNSTVVTATPAIASANNLTVTVPAGADVVGDVSVSVRSQGQDSNGLTALIPQIQVIFNGGFQ